MARSARDSTGPQLSKGGGEEALAEGPFILSEGLSAYKLVKRIWKREYVDTAELLHDNMEMSCRQGLRLTDVKTHTL